MGKAANLAAIGSIADTPLMFRNRIINPGMVIDQRNAGASAGYTAATQTYTLDRWMVYGSVGSKFTIQQNAGSVTPPAGFTNYLGITSSSANTPGSTDIYALAQRIEGFNIADLGWGSASAQSVTLSFWVRSSVTGTQGGSLFNSAANLNYVFSFTINSANTWEYKTIQIAGPTSGTWVTNNGIGLTLWWNFGSGSSNLGTAGSWGATGFYGPTGAANALSANGATFYITGVQLERGANQNPVFEHRPYGVELAMCQRYFQVSGNGTGQAFSTSTLSVNYALPVTMRDNPSGTYINGTNGLIRFGGSNESFSSIGVFVSRQNFVGINLSGSGYGVGSIYMTATQGAINFSAEL